MPDLPDKATMLLAGGEILPSGPDHSCDSGLIPAHKARKAAQSGAATCDSGVLVCIMA
ncbi:hypothetical protein [Ruegeria sp. Alg231-54]|uniref:hypothetical protein n=1 Tax=Ruegeria sp. Alg231-54 TaxID=1922221 RepID=UPI00131EE45B|nr:hypothetical protein [Ruegeria sp. Alg231-54]